MNTLFDSVISQKFKSYFPFKEFADSLQNKVFPLAVHGLHGSMLALIWNRYWQRDQKGALLVFPSEKEAEQFCMDCQSFDLPFLHFPWWGTAPYHDVARTSPIFGRRVEVLSALRGSYRGLVVTSVRALLSKLPSVADLDQACFVLAKGNEVNTKTLAEKLTNIHYLRVNRVSVPGEFALRGEVLDLWMPGDDLAIRLGLAFDKIEEIRRFDPVTQSSHGKVEQVRVHPFREQLWQTAMYSKLRDRLDRLAETKQRDSRLKDELMQSLIDGNARGEETWYPIAVDNAASLIDYLDPALPVCLIDYERLYAAAEALEREYLASWRKLRIEQPLLPRPERLLWALGDLQLQIKRLVVFPVLNTGTSRLDNPLEQSDEGSDLSNDMQAYSSHEKAREDQVSGSSESPEDGDEWFGTTGEGRQKPPHFEAKKKIQLSGEGSRSWFGNINFLKDELSASIKAGYKIFVFAESEAQAARIDHLLGDLDVNVLPQRISSGFAIASIGLLVIEENEIFGRRKRISSTLQKVQSQVLDTFVDLEPRDYVVHVNHGIGRFCGIRRIMAGDTERDYIELEYADQEFIFVPIEQVNLVQRYIGSQGGEPRLDTIGGKSWEKRTSAVRKSVEDIAGRLIELYSRRKKARGFAFPPDNEWQIEFESSFPFEETEDQIKCIREVKEDMEKPLPMDRLVCGDVGYGKTEIALRAAFKAVSAGKQVAFLAPTTILVEQHFEGLLERIKDFPVKIGMLSRFVPQKEQKKVLAQLADGQVDMVIGTHRLLQKDVAFKDLGLIIVDEEQRFGVKDKERLKEMKHSVDSLTLTATPIPRTLHMSLLKIRDMSVLQTPPYNRRPIETCVRGFDEQTVAMAIRREIERGGQVFYLHNRVESLENVMQFIQTVVPEVMVECAHGQMGPTELEDIMHRFIHGSFQVLVATTIIENGINIPNVNTIIIDRADMYGISQLYQLRGRVGRSGRLAYAYLLYPGERALSELAMKRLQIISDYTELGSGFKIALKDLEVRGAGNLLGSEQSGEIVSVGFDLYLKLLDEAIRRLAKEGKADEEQEIYLDLEYSGFIPDTYVSQASDKMEVYKKVASIVTTAQLESVHAELTDRFGPLPDEVLSLLGLAEIRILCRSLHVVSLKERKGQLEVEFGKVSQLNVGKVMELIRSSAGAVKPDPLRPQVLLMKTEHIGLKEKSEFIRDRLNRLVLA